MDDCFEYEGIRIPLSVQPVDMDNLEWGQALFKKLAETTDSPESLWKLMFDQVFTEAYFTENHRYFLCILISSEITKMYMQLEQDMMMQQSFGDNVPEGVTVYQPPTPKLILP